jgi:integrase
VEGKFASAHDLRRSFGTRWAPRLKPATLQLLMRHKSIETTMKYYVCQDSDDVADELWAEYEASHRGKAG